MVLHCIIVQRIYVLTLLFIYLFILLFNYLCYQALLLQQMICLIHV